MIVSALLSALHLLTLAIGLGAIVERGRALAGPLDAEGWKRLLAADNLWGAAAGLWIVTGVGRVFVGGKSPDFYWHNGFFWVKLALFALVFVLEIAPMVTFMRVRLARRRRAPLPQFSAQLFRRINLTETVLVMTIVVVAAFMARGTWLF